MQRFGARDASVLEAAGRGGEPGPAAEDARGRPAADAEQAGPILKELGLPADIRAEYAVELVPTFIFSSGGVELGRIEETPEQSLEADATAILVDLIPVTDTGTSQWR